MHRLRPGHLAQQLVGVEHLPVVIAERVVSRWLPHRLLKVVAVARLAQ
jgi:hypothetical protein